MAENEWIVLLDGLRFSNSGSERNRALNELKLLEIEGKVNESDLLRLAEDRDFVFQLYAVGAIGRLKIQSGIPLLKRLFERSVDPLALTALLDAFSEFESDLFIDCVLKKLRLFLSDVAKDPSHQHSFLLEQIIVPALKYFQVSGNQTVQSTVEYFLDDSNPTIRWHALVTFDKLGLPIEEAKLISISQTDAYGLSRELASLMLEKRKRSPAD